MTETDDQGGGELRDGPAGEGATAPAAPQTRERILRFQNLHSGALFAGRYEVREPLGAGGAGEVYRAWDRVARAEVALKVLFPGSGERDLERLRREMRVVRSLQHPGIVRVHDIGESEGLFYTVSELLEGESLAGLLRRERRLDPAQAERILRGVLEALAVAHDAGVIHRDIKPANIFLCGSGAAAPSSPARVVLLDFGLARPAAEPGLTMTGAFVGTPEYCSPEQIRGEKDLRPATDLYACGITLWRMLAGKAPFTGNSEVEVLNAHLTAPLPPPRRELRGAPPRLRALATQLLEKDPARRPADARAALRWLDLGEGLSARAAIAWIGLSSLLRRRAVRLATAGSALLIAGALVLGWLAVPVGVGRDREDPRSVVWTTRGGWTWKAGPLPRTIQSAAMMAPAGGLTASALVTLAAKGEDQAASLHQQRPVSLLYKVSYPWGEARPFPAGATAMYLLGPGPYLFHDPLMTPENILRIDGVPGPSGPLFALSAHHVANFPARIAVFHGNEDVYSIYNHPGWIYAAAAWPAAAPRLLIVAARNNLLGPRMVVFGFPLPSPSVFIGQGPPYTGLGGYDETSLWYLPLPWSANVAMSIEADERTATIRSRDGQSIRIDPARGIPADAPDRGGLGSDEWDRRRGAVLRGLEEAAKRGQQGEPAGGAAKLEAVAQALDGPAELRSLVLYRAALLRMESSRAEGSGALNAALDDCRAALSAEPDPERYGLLEAEILGRLGRQEEARRSLVEWGNRGHAGRYQFEWVLLNWLAGKGLDPGAFLGPAGITASPVSTGELAILEALHKGDATRAREIIGSQGESLVQYTCGDFHYLKARALLDLDPPDAEAALAALKQAAEGCVLGTPIPAALARARARLMLEPAAAVTPDEARAAASDLGQVFSQAYVDVTALFFAQFALRDAEAILKARPGLEPLAAAAAKARAEYDRMVHFEPVAAQGVH